MVVETGGIDPRWILPVAVLIATPYLGVAYWVYRDAGRRGSERATTWGVGMVLLGPVNPLGLAFYLLARRNLEGTPTPPTRFDSLVRNVVVASFLTFVVVAVVTPPDPYTQLYAVAVALPVLVALAVVMVYRDVLASML